MGRKIPAKKHRGVKDPIVQQARRLEGLKGKINAPPKDPDEQPVPKSLTRLFAFQDKVLGKKITKKNKINSRIRNSKGGAGPNPVSQMRKLPGESGRDFSLRINSAVKALHNPVEDLHYPRDFEAEDEKGLRMSEHRERRARKRRKAAQASRGDSPAAVEPRLSRTQKLALKKKAKKSKAIEASNERQEVVYERVSFGEVTHAPPALHFKSAAAGAPRPGRRQLLLSSLLGPGAGPRAPPAGAHAAGAQAAERARLQAVAAYRALKANKHKVK